MSIWNRPGARHQRLSILSAEEEDIVDVSGQNMDYEEDPNAIYRPVNASSSTSKLNNDR